MPHINIKYFPVSLDDTQKTELVSALVQAITNTFKCKEEVISISLEPVEKELWNEEVYLPQIVNRAELLCKSPIY